MTFSHSTNNKKKKKKNKSCIEKGNKRRFHETKQRKKNLFIFREKIGCMCVCVVYRA